ncbi:hypothetical protein B7Y94_02445 [Candidatus Saccharibacteria bacterium 32-49-12]|nr:MAG: hypothetical protein B7Y94_02445 [Candidatus Saccharibacteria bacterium 32-49-12]
MKKGITTICLLGSGILIVDSLDVMEAVAFFLIAGRIPGTDIGISATAMHLACTAALGVIIGRLSSRPIIRRVLSMPNTPDKKLARA